MYVIFKRYSGNLVPLPDFSKRRRLNSGARDVREFLDLSFLVDCYYSSNNGDVLSRL